MAKHAIVFGHHLNENVFYPFFVENGLSRWVTQEEALDIFNKSIEAGCGVCAVTCADDAIKTYRKEESLQFVPEPDRMSSIMKIYQERKD
ncbi:MAG: hypothetical protein HN580_28210 [Deltaproteobacteria bacterium]|jgi:hypothetical protein|nr:hypothetical protein [Deltaproteobacteria bacterium]MBT4087674.1 hypothetical protein [Deltaproteobacteria bacterium]MBT4267685.1 hypothetical protein [Deltaproteobacteria bacterium]MBT4639280.1 hypothetical protein [Deltaproteobacteria bacterium]MBT6504126.1 hypothetical protein [Deltaproteobacteria bacterium]